MSKPVPPPLRSRDYFPVAKGSAQFRELLRAVDDLRRRQREAQTLLARIHEEVAAIREHIRTQEQCIPGADEDDAGQNLGMSSRAGRTRPRPTARLVANERGPPVTKQRASPWWISGEALLNLFLAQAVANSHQRHGQS